MNVFELVAVMLCVVDGRNTKLVRPSVCITLIVSAPAVVLTVKLPVEPPFFWIDIVDVLTLNAVQPDVGLLVSGDPVVVVPVLPQGLMAEAGLPPDTVAPGAMSFD